jgi:hypothetical protein
MTRTLLVITALLLLAPNFIDWDLNRSDYYTPPYDNKEKYDPSLGYINSVAKLAEFVDENARQQGIEKGSLAYVVAMEDAIEKRFYHGFSHLTTSDNWIAAFSEKLFGFGLSCKVIPSEIMLHGNAACSQQSMVMMELLKKQGLAYRKVGFPHHFALEVQVNNRWYYFDPNMEPTMTAEQRHEASWQHKADNLKQYYDPQRFTDLDYKFGVGEMVAIGGVNEPQASNARFFQWATSLLSKTLWLAPLFLLFAGYRRKANATTSKRSYRWGNLMQLFLPTSFLQKA